MKASLILRKTRNVLFTLVAVTTITNSYAQKEPSWLNASWRESQYPSTVFIKGFAQDGLNKNESMAEATERIKNIARGNLSESIVASVQSVTDSYSQSVMVGGSESIKETLKSEIKVSSDLVINGIKIESFVKDNIVYGFAYANKYEVIGYYKANLNMQIQQIEGFINTAKELEQNREKNKAKEEFNKSLPIFEEVKKAQGILSALDKNISEDDLKMQKTMNLYNEVIQANARLAQGIYVYLVSNEDIFGEKSKEIENGLKSILAKNGCSFTTEESVADWKIFVDSKAREYNQSNKIYFSYVDAEVKLYKAPSDKHVYQNEFSQKGAHGKSYKSAAKKADEEISKQISEEILKWINN